MAQYIVWYTLQLKAWAKRKTSWAQVLGMVLLALLISQIHLPGAENTKIGICAAPEKSAQRILEALKTRESIFEFSEYAGEADMRQDILSGVIECGFVFSGDDARKGAVTYICTPFSAKGLVAQETFFAAFFEGYSDKILTDNEADIFGKSDEDITRKLLEKKQDYLRNNVMFQMDIIETGQKPAGDAFRIGNVSGKIPPVRGGIGLFIFTVLWMTQAGKFEDYGSGAAAAMERGQRWKFEYLGCLAKATIPAVLGTALILSAPESRGLVIETGSMLLLVFVSSFWVLAVGRLFRNSTTFAAWTLTMILAQVVVCPVFFDLAAFVPAVRAVRWIFPLGWLY